MVSMRCISGKLWMWQSQHDRLNDVYVLPIATLSSTNTVNLFVDNVLVQRNVTPVYFDVTSAIVRGLDDSDQVITTALGVLATG